MTGHTGMRQGRTTRCVSAATVPGATPYSEQKAHQDLHSAPRFMPYFGVCIVLSTTPEKPIMYFVTLTP